MKKNQLVKLYKAFIDEQKTLIKTKKGNLYGIWNVKINKEFIPPTYIHIYEADGDMLVALKANGDYIRLDRSGIESDIPESIKSEYQQYIIKGDKCNCDNGCAFCEWTNVVFNKLALQYNFRFLKDFDSFDSDFDY